MAAVAVDTSRKAGFWIRVLAYLIDSAILIAVYVVTSFVITDFVVNYAVNIVIDLIYFIYFWSASGGGQTPGMRVFGPRVVRTDGTPLDYVRALLRNVGLIVAVIPILIGVIWVAFDENKQGWHDKIAGTYVVKTK